MGFSLSDLKNSRWRTSVILKIVKSPYLNERLSDFDEIWYTNAELKFDDSRMIEYENCQNSRWRMAAILEIIFGHN